MPKSCTRLINRQALFGLGFLVAFAVTAPAFAEPVPLDDLSPPSLEQPPDGSDERLWQDYPNNQAAWNRHTGILPLTGWGHFHLDQSTGEPEVLPLSSFPATFLPAEPNTIKLLAFALFFLFAITLKANYGDQRFPSQLDAPSGDTPSKRVLIVDDDAGITSMLTLLLTKMRYETHALLDSTKVLPWLMIHPCDTMVLDLRMPHLDGLALLQLIRQRFASLPVVIYTGAAPTEVLSSELFLAERDAYVSKAMPIEELCSALKRIPAFQ